MRNSIPCVGGLLWVVVLGLCGCGGSTPVTDNVGGELAAAAGANSVTAGGAPGHAGGGAAAADGLAPASGGEMAEGGSAASGPDTGGLAGGAPAPDTCTASQPVGTRDSGTGPHEVLVETNSDAGISEGTIFRPATLGRGEKYPIFIWGEGGCSLDGLSNEIAMIEIASHGYFVVADGTPNGTGNRPMDRSNLEAMAAPFRAYVDWAIAENAKPCSAYFGALEPTRIAANGFSCGGLMAQAIASDPRLVTWGVTSSGMAGAAPAFYDSIHTPVLFVEGGPTEVAYDGGREGYENIAGLGVPVLWFSKDLGHGGDLFQPSGGDFTRINLAWLNWWLKGDETATGKALLVGPSCPYCGNGEWEVRSENLP